MPEENTLARANAFRREAYLFSDDLDAGVGRSYVLPFDRDGTLERLYVRFYPGARLRLTLKPQIFRSDRRERVVALRGKPSLSGENDVLDLKVSIPVYKDDSFVLDAANIDPDGPHSFLCFVEVDYAGGAFPRGSVTNA